ncbi:MAG TPA: RtcB family protein [Abditibacteriaceae bacterium]|jgi:tRNA-splicing ligase RtcB
MITGKILKARGWPEGKIIGRAKAAALALETQDIEREEILTRLDAVLAKPADFIGDAVFGEVAREVLRRESDAVSREADVLLDEALPYVTWGAEGIDVGAVSQMENAMRLPVAVGGALMPDAHVGYGLPIGGVLATKDCVIPYAVGVDIACRMRLSIYPQSPIVLGQKSSFEKALVSQTVFGAGGKWKGTRRAEHEVIDDTDWTATKLLRGLQHKASEQLGTSGSGNHFVEWGEFVLTEDNAELNLKAGTYLALLSHSGSRGVGFKIANEYSRIAREVHPRLADSVRHLAWLNMDSEAGAEYWLSMELAGKFASANHAIIHQRVAEAAGVQEIAAVENHHNFAWRESVNGEEAIVHRKGATPAGLGVFGVIPGSMADAGYVVRGRGVESSLNSASHGAGRRMSRREANNSITKTQRDRYLEERGVKLLSAGLDEAPQAYKDIETVVAAQSELVEIVGKFSPRIVKMADDGGGDI